MSELVERLPFSHIENLRQLLPDVPPDSILSRSIHRDDRVTVTLFGFAAGEELSEHTAAYPAILHFLEGTAKLTLGNEEMEAKAGTWVHMAPHLPHSIVASTPVIMLLTLLKQE